MLDAPALLFGACGAAALANRLWRSATARKEEEEWIVNWDDEREKASWLGPWVQQPLNESCFLIQPAPASKGLGLFAAVPIKRGAYLFDYEGALVTDEAYQGSDYALEIQNAAGNWFLIDAADLQASNLARYMNHGRRYANCELMRQAYNLRDAGKEDAPPPRVHVLAGRDIKQGEELCFDYGNSFWQATSELTRRSAELEQLEERLGQLQLLADAQELEALQPEE
uniref:SET domain-containing protein n=1 Tax=Haptolina ericina TaxID=156174 RepID=A0A7S3ESW1_9EUKA